MVGPQNIGFGDQGVTRKKRIYKTKDGPRYTKKQDYPWLSRKPGRLGLCALLHYMLGKATEDQLRRHKLSEIGISTTKMTNWLLKVLPELDADIKLYNGTGLTVSMVNGRAGNMRRQNSTGVLIALGDEYPKNHPVLGPLFDMVTAHLHLHDEEPGCLSMML